MKSPTDEPAPESAKEPADGPAAESAKEPADEPTEEPAEEPADEPTREPAEEPVKSPAAEPPAERTSQFVPLRSADDARPARRTGRADATTDPRPAPDEPRKAGAAAADAPAPPGACAPAPSAGTAASARSAGAVPAPEAAEPERTRQQPMPPEPGRRPLDLLAELTNRPAPPETPLRAALRRLKIYTPLVALLAVVFVTVQLLRPLPAPELDLTANATYSFDGGEPRIAWPEEGQAAMEVDGLGSFGTSGAQEPVPIASVAKVMTAYLLLKEHPMEPGEPGASIPVDQQAEDDAGLSEQGESTVGVRAGETISQEEALNALMIASANNVARLVARWDAGSEKAFVEKMNATAEDLGMQNTTYTDPSGLRAETVSTAEDQVRLGKAVMEYEVFREIVRKPSYEDRNGTSHRNWNFLVPEYGTVGIKTGTTTAAGGNLLFAATADVGGTEQLIIGAVLGQHAPPIIDSVLAEGKELILSAQAALRSETVVRQGEVVGAVDDGLGGRTSLVATEDVAAVGWAGLTVELDLAAGKDGVPHTAGPGTEVGHLTVGDGPGQVRVPVAVQRELTEPDATAKITRLS
ncbi:MULTISPECIES: serine hydrolase [Streptomyces]|uniref:serine hydrolase n=1 Tax=Streptomyces TaxID=1883 RepID=UPI0022489C8D|nr:serine hydrolase [Streptomyces sp. JHD 1]MCX2968248.1 serine hydrolase [Streptomyces sp. JHD 1]